MSTLCIDTAGPVIGAALGASSWSARVVRGADGLLTPALGELLAAEAPPERVAVSIGPGSFTSLRVGVAAALGLVMAQRLPLVPVSSLQARAALVPGEERVLALLDGRKGRAYVGLFDCSGAPALRAPEQDLPPEQAIALAGGPGFVAVGEGAQVWRALIEAAGGRVCEDPARSPVGAMASLASVLPAVEPEALRLNYLRGADAVPPRR